jgi:hypothetical protein
VFKLERYIFEAVKGFNMHCYSSLENSHNLIYSLRFAGRRRAAAKKKKLKNLGKSKSTDTEEEEGEDDQDDGELYFAHSISAMPGILFFLFTFFTFEVMTSSGCSNELVVRDRNQVVRDFLRFLSSQNLCPISQRLLRKLPL